MRKIRPDIIQTSLPQMDILGGAAALVTRVPWVLKESSSASGYPANWKSRLRSVLAKSADAIVSNSRQGEVYWRANKIKCPLYVIPNGISFEGTAETGPADLSLDPAAKILLFAGRMDSGKNLENLLIALSLVDTAFTAILCGDGPLRPALEELAAELGIKSRVIFTGYVSNLWSLMKRADAFLFLSRFEGCPNVVLEAMACGCPLIVSDIPAHREILDDRSACFVNLDEVTEIAAAVKTTLLLEGPARDRADAAQERAAQWTIEVMAQRYEELYLRISAGSATTT
jgi:glycosyltransferase involved in cell wall biosynthesis